MFRYIKKNKEIPAFFAKVAANPQIYQPKIELLKDVIRTGNFNPANSPDIFSDAEAPLLLLYAIEQKLVPYWPGMTLHAYFVALAQFTDKQTMRAEHMKDESVKTHVKHARNVIPVSLTEVVDGVTKISAAGHEYIDYQVYLYKYLGMQLDKEALCRFILAMPDHVERTIFKIETYWANYNQLDIDSSLREFRENVPFFKCRQEHYFVLPSFTLTTYFLNAAGDKPMQLMPFLGILNNNSVHEWHEKNTTPVSMYVKELVNYMMLVHGRSCGPFPLLVHDIGHGYWATLLSGAERTIINRDLMPFFTSLKAQFTTDAAVDLLTRINNDLTDYDLTPLTNYKNAKTRFVIYVIAVLKRKINNINNAMQVENHDSDILIALRQYVCTKMVEYGAHPFWANFCIELDKTFKAILHPLVPEVNESPAVTVSPMQQNSFFAHDEPETNNKKHKSDAQQTATVITSKFGINLDCYC